MLASHRALKKNKESEGFLKMSFILRKECLVCLLFVFRSILSGENEKFLASCKIGCSVNLKHTRTKTGAGGGRGITTPRDLQALPSTCRK